MSVSAPRYRYRHRHAAARGTRKSAHASPTTAAAARGRLSSAAATTAIHDAATTTTASGDSGIFGVSAKHVYILLVVQGKGHVPGTRRSNYGFGSQRDPFGRIRIRIRDHK
mgnify:CR=1 FL=1